MRFMYPVVVLVSVLAVTACSQRHVAYRDKQGIAAKNYALTYEQVREAAQDGDADAQYALGYMYYYGQNVTRNSQKAQYWIGKAAAQKHAQATRALNILGHETQLASRGEQPNKTDAVEVSPVGSVASNQNKWQEVRRPREAVTPKDAFEQQAQSGGAKSAQQFSNAADTSLRAADASPSQSRQSFNASSSKVVAAESNQGGSVASQSAISSEKNQAHSRRKHVRSLALKSQKGKRYTTKPSNGTALSASASNAPSDSLGVKDSKETLKSAKTPKVSAHQIKSKAVAARSAQGKWAAATNRKLTGDERSILASPNNHYTLQLIGTTSQANVRQVIDRNHLRPKAKVYHSQLNGKDFYVLIYGSYGSQAEASAAIARLPANVQQLKPWVKQFSSIKASVNAKASSRT